MNRFLSCIAKQFNPCNHVDNKKVYRLNRRHRFSSCITNSIIRAITLTKTTHTAKSFNFTPSTLNVQCSPQNFRTSSPSEHHPLQNIRTNLRFLRTSEQSALNLSTFTFNRSSFNVPRSSFTSEPLNVQLSTLIFKR